MSVFCCLEFAFFFNVIKREKLDVFSEQKDRKKKKIEEIMSDYKETRNNNPDILHICKYTHVQEYTYTYVMYIRTHIHKEEEGNEPSTNKKGHK